MDERSPDAMVESAFDGLPYSISENFIKVPACRWAPGRAVGDFRELPRKTVEVVDRFRVCRHVDEFSVHVPVGAHENDRLGFFKTRSQFVEDADVRVAFRRLEREHG